MGKASCRIKKIFYKNIWRYEEYTFRYLQNYNRKEVIKMKEKR